VGLDESRAHRCRIPPPELLNAACRRRPGDPPRAEGAHLGELRGAPQGLRSDARPGMGRGL